MSVSHPPRCGWSFERLDPDHTDPGRRSFVKCQHCDRPYIEANWQGICTKLGCESKNFVPVALQSSPREPVHRRVALPFCSGPLNTLSDLPLGLSTGTLFFPDSSYQQLQIKNNSQERISIPRIFGPSWLSVQLSEPSDPSQIRISGDQIYLEPGATAEITVHAHTIRAIRAEEFYPIHGDQGVQIVTSQDARIVRMVQVFISFLAIFHFLRVCQWVREPDWSTACSAAWTGALLSAVAVFLTPRFLVGGLIRFGIQKIPAEGLLLGTSGQTVYRRALSRLLSAMTAAGLLTVLLIVLMGLTGRIAQAVSPPLICLIFAAGLVLLISEWQSVYGNHWIIAAWSRIQSIRNRKKSGDSKPVA